MIYYQIIKSLDIIKLNKRFGFYRASTAPVSKFNGKTKERRKLK